MDLPIVRVTDIPDDGFSIECDVLPSDIALTETDARVQHLLSVSVGLHKAGKMLDVRGAVAGTFVRQCVRCLKEFDVFVRVSFTVEYHPHAPVTRRTAEGAKGTVPGAGPHRTEESADPIGDEQDVYEYNGEEVDLAAMLREQIILATPMQPLCDQDCRGLCPVCGQDRNERVCGCPEQAQPNPFSALQGLRDSLRESPHRPMRSKTDPQRN
jgi:uncharacterized protein